MEKVNIYGEPVWSGGKDCARRGGLMSKMQIINDDLKRNDGC
jgi:hypothetical protein